LRGRVVDGEGKEEEDSADEDDLKIYSFNPTLTLTS